MRLTYTDVFKIACFEEDIVEVLKKANRDIYTIPIELEHQLLKLSADILFFLKDHVDNDLVKQVNTEIKTIYKDKNSCKNNSLKYDLECLACDIKELKNSSNVGSYEQLVALLDSLELSYEI